MIIQASVYSQPDVQGWYIIMYKSCLRPQLCLAVQSRWIRHEHPGHQLSMWYRSSLLLALHILEMEVVVRLL